MKRQAVKFNSLNPLLFFAQFIGLCNAEKCGKPLATTTGSIDDICGLDETEYPEQAQAPTPTRAQVAAELRRTSSAHRTPRPGGHRGRGHGRDSTDTPRPSDISDREYEAAIREALQRRKEAERYIDECRQIAGLLRQAVEGDAIGEQTVTEVLGDTGVNGPKAFKALWVQHRPISQATLTHVMYEAFRQGDLALNEFLAQLGKFFHMKSRCGSKMTDREKCDAMITRVSTEHFTLAQASCIQHNYDWASVVKTLLHTTHLEKVRQVMAGNDVAADNNGEAFRAIVDDAKCRECGRKGHFANECINAKNIDRAEKTRRFEKWVTKAQETGHLAQRRRPRQGAHRGMD